MYYKMTKLNHEKWEKIFFHEEKCSSMFHFDSISEMNYNPEELQSYLSALESYYQGRNEKSK
jgi:hypothetical protein